MEGCLGVSVAIYNELDNKINKLKQLLSNIDSENLIGIVASEFGITTDINESIFEKTQLKSPFKQYLYLIGLLLSTEDVNISITKEPPMKEIKKLLNEITDLYAGIFFSTEGQDVEESWLEARKIAMPVFLHYFNTNSLIYEEQLVERMREWFIPFDKYIEEKMGIRVEELLKIFNFIRDNLQKRLKKLQLLNFKVKKEQENFFKYMEKKNVPLEQAKNEFKVPNAIKFVEELQLTHQVEIKDLVNEFGEDVARNFISRFTMIREESKFFYYTEQNPFEASPIWRKSDELLFVPMYKQIIHAIQIQLTSLLESSEQHREKYYKNRDAQAEDKALKIFKRLFKEKATYYTSVFENDKSQNEHDLLIKQDNTIFIVEVKASKVKEPFRDPDKAYKRIKRDFKSDGGIQKGYDQALNLKNLILNNDETILYDSKGKELVKLERDRIEKIFLIVITAEDLGILSTNLSYLLEKPLEESYPWACNLYDLETALDGIIYKQGSEDTFIQYLEERQEYHEYIVATDELEILGFFLKKGSLRSLFYNKDGMIMFDPESSSIFDEIYFEKRGITKKRPNRERKQEEKRNANKLLSKKKKRKQSKFSKRNNRKK